MTTNYKNIEENDPLYEEKISEILQDLVYNCIKQNPNNIVRIN